MTYKMADEIPSIDETFDEAPAADYDSAIALQERLEGADTWPIAQETKAQSEVRRWRAMQHTDRSYLKSLANWNESEDGPYVADPLPSRIADAFSDLIFGEDPNFISFNEVDQELLDALVTGNQLPSELQRTAAAVVAEGEQWWRLLVDPNQLEVPVIEWHSRLDVVPLFVGKQIKAVGFVSELEVEEKHPEGAEATHWRYIEIQARGLCLNLLYKGTSGSLGTREELAAHQDTEELDEEYEHGLPHKLCGRVVNGFGRNGFYLGKSQFHDVKDLIMALNEAASIGQSNAKLTARKRIIMPDTYVDQHGKVPALQGDVIIRSEAHKDPDSADGGFTQLEWSFDASALIQYKTDLITTIASRAGLTLHFVDQNSGDGAASSGTQERLRMLPSTIAAEGKARYWDDELPFLLMVAAVLDSESDDFDASWSEPFELPGVERTDPIPTDPIEEATKVTTLRISGLLSKRTSLEILFPDWTVDRVEEELALLEEEEEKAAALLLGPEEVPEVDPDVIEEDDFEEEEVEPPDAETS